MSTPLPLRSGPLAPGIAFITGGARGLGNAIAVSFAKEGSAGVVLVDIQPQAVLDEGRKNVEAYGTKCITIRADVTQEADVEAAVATAVAEFGRIDYAANFAGIIGPSDPISSLSLPEWEKIQAVNSTGVFLCTKHELRQMMKQSSIAVESSRHPQHGSIVNCASVNSLMTMAGSGAYTAAKHAVAGITKTAALEARTHCIRVNSVSPGFLLTPMVTEGLQQNGTPNSTPSTTGKEEANKDHMFDSSMWTGFEARQGRRARFEEVGDVVVLLSTPRMGLVNGVNLFIDGGFTINESNH